MRLKLLMPASTSREVLQMLEAKNTVIEAQDLSGAQDSQVQPNMHTPIIILWYSLCIEGSLLRISG